MPLRGYPIYKDAAGVWRFRDNDEPTHDTWRDRPCGHCGQSFDGDHDPCLGQLPGVVNACCGHGDPRQAYVRFENGFTIRGFTIEPAEEAR